MAEVIQMNGQIGFFDFDERLQRLTIWVIG